MSKIYLDRKDPTGPYLFISYSHADKDAIRRVLTALNDKGANFWYDIDMHSGQGWFEKMCQVTDDKRCTGIIFFVSADFIISDPCYDELKRLDKLTASHDRFESVFVLIGDEETPNFTAFKSKAMLKLILDGKNPDEINAAMMRFSAKFDTGKIYRAATFDNIDDEEFVNTLFDETFKAWGCASEEVGILDALQATELIDRSYSIKTTCRIHTDKVHRRDIEWKAFAYSGNTVSAILVSDELFAETCLSLAQPAMNSINDGVITSLDQIPERDPNTRDGKTKNDRDDVKYILFEPAFAECLRRDENGNVLRYLKSFEREKHFLQLRGALEKVPVADSADDGYFFVMDGKGRIMFADRGSDDVYRHVHVDAYASVVPVIDIDYNKYREYVLAKNKA